VTTDTERLSRDVHPVDVVGDQLDSVYVNARVLVTSSRLLIFTATDGRIAEPVELALTEPIAASRGTLNGGRLELQTEVGTVWVNPGRGCGCGSPLKAMARPLDW
jgi:hypothetical protein